MTAQSTLFTRSSAVLSPCRRYRYLLTRIWDVSLPSLAIVGLNPSAADEETDDATIRKEMGFARRLGCGSLQKANLFALRSRDPKALRKEPYPVGEGDGGDGNSNDHTISALAQAPGLLMVLAAWGSNEAAASRAERAIALVTEHRDLYAFRLTAKTGAPEHPLYIPYETTPVLYRARRLS